MTKKLSKKKILYLQKDIEKMFDSFRENNFKKNPVYQYVLEMRNKNDRNKTKIEYKKRRSHTRDF